MTKVCFILLSSLAFWSCKKNSDGYTGPKYAYEFYNAARIDTIMTGYPDYDLFFRINPGNDIVFIYSHVYGPERDSIAAFADSLVFKVPANTNSFLYRDNQLQDAMCLFIKYAYKPGFPRTYGAFRVNSGFVKGTKISSVGWDVEIDVAINPSGIDRISGKWTFVPH